MLLPKNIIEDELYGYRNRWLPEFILKDMKCRYSVSMRTILLRAEQVGIITNRLMGKQLGYINKKYGGKYNEGVTLPDPGALNRQERLVYEALFTERISMSRAAELLSIPLMDVRAKMEEWLNEVDA